MSFQRWLIYALGGGFGHLTRACALARAAFPDTQVRILTNSQYASHVASAAPEVNMMAAQEFESALSAADCLIVDTFPRGLAGELVNILPTFSGLKVFVRRDLNPDYVAKYNVDAFVGRSYDLALIAGDASGPHHTRQQPGVMTAPWLIRSTRELPDRERARQLLGLGYERPCVLVCAAGNVEELGWYGATVAGLLEYAQRCEVRCVSPSRPDGCPPEFWIQYWPAMDLYSAAAVLIGGAGYNTVYESLACGIPLVARPWPRKYDRQSLRAGRGAARIVDTPQQAISAAMDLLRGPRPRPSGAENGALQAVAQIREKLLHRAIDPNIHRV